MRTFRFEIFPTTDQIRVFRLYGPADKPLGERTLDGISSFIHEVEGGYATGAPDLLGLGRRLFAWLDGPTERWLAQALPGPDGVALHVEVEERLRHLPWELLLGADGFLCADAARPFTPVRRVGTSSRDVTIANRALRVLLMACSPLDVQPVLDYEGEERMILDATRDRPIELVVEESGTLEGLREQMESHGPGYFDVFHLTGHADVCEGTPVFVMEDELGWRRDATAEEIAEAFSGIWPRLVFLSGCRTGQAPIAGALPSLAEALVSAGAPAVLGWALPVGDIGASQAAAELYEQVAVGKRLDESVARARQRLLAHEDPFWHLLRLYADATPLEPMVTPLKTKDRKPVRVRHAPAEFLDAGSKVEVCPRERFVGRRRPLQRCLRVLTSYPGEPEHAEGVLIQGMGGLGKSSLAARLCDRMPEHRRVVLVGNLDEDGFLRALGGKLDSIDALDILNRGGVPLQMRLRLLLDGPLAAVPLLFVLDDFEHALEGSGNEYVLRASALAVLAALLAAIRDTASASRVIVTSRYGFSLPGPARLAPEGLTSMRGADLDKKVEQLATIESTRRTDPALAKRVIAAGAGNPRLLERLETLIRNFQTDATEVLDGVEGEAAEFREELLLTAILKRQEPGLRRLVAYASIFEVPVRGSAVAAAAGDDLLGLHLDRAVSLGLIEAGGTPESADLLHFVSMLVRPLIKEELDDVERKAAASRAAHYFFGIWQTQPLSEDDLLEIHRIAIYANQEEMAVRINDVLAARWFNVSRFRDAKALTLQTLALGPDVRVLNSLAKAEWILGDTAAARDHYEAALEVPLTDKTDEGLGVRAVLIHNYAVLVEQQGEPERALQLYQQSLELKEKIGDVPGKAATLHQMAAIYDLQGEPERALKLYQQSLDIQEKIGYMKGKAATLHQMAVVYARQGKSERALRLYQQSLELKEKIGDVQGEAATLHQMAGIYAQQGEPELALQLYQNSLDLEEKTGHIQGIPPTLHAMADIYAEQGEPERALQLYQQSLELREKMGDVQGKASTLHQMAAIYDRQGESERALQLYQQSLELKEKIGDVQGKAATLHQMAYVYDRQGEPERAFHLYQQSLDLQEKIGNVLGKAATLAQLASLFLRQGKRDEAIKRLIESARALAGIRAWPNLATVLANLAGAHKSKPAFLLQAVWIGLRVWVPIQQQIHMSMRAIEALGRNSQAARLIAGATMIVSVSRTERHPKAEALREQAFGLLAATAVAVGVEREQFSQWIEAERLLDADTVIARALTELEARVPEDQWLFDRHLLSKDAT